MTDAARRSPGAPPARSVRRGAIAAYSVGAAAYGIKDAAFGTFLLLFYNQVVGLPAASVGLAIMLALVIDACVDPAVGFLSDHTRGRWGRRHPWMYASALPILLAWIALWNPPAGRAAILWLFAAAVVVRTAISCYEVPSVALTPELSSDYDERTRIMAWRYLFGWAGGLLTLASAYLLFLAPTPAFANGLLNPAGYGPFAIATGLAMALAILVSAWGTHREIPNLPQADAKPQAFRDNLRELGATLRNRPFLILMGAGLCAYVNQGIGYALSNYLYTYVWGFRGATFFHLALVLFAGVFAAFLAAPRLGKRFGKKRTATGAVLVGALFLTAPYWLRLAGAFPQPGEPLLIPLFFLCLAIGTGANVSGFVLGASMVADVVEESEARTGRRSEGVFFAGSFFVQKCTSGIGIFLAGAILAVAGFPERATPGRVSVETVDRLTLTYGVIYVTLALLAAFAFTRFPFGRAEHEARVRRLGAG